MAAEATGLDSNGPASPLITFEGLETRRFREVEEKQEVLSYRDAPLQVPHETAPKSSEVEEEIEVPLSLDLVKQKVFSIASQFFDDEVSGDTDLQDGLDSLNISLLTENVNRNFGLNINIVDILQFGTVSELCDGLMALMPKQTAKKSKQVSSKPPAAYSTKSEGARAPGSLLQSPSGLVAGMQVQLAKLKERPDLNGLGATLIGYIPAQRRWQIKIDDDTEFKLLMEQNLEVRTATPQSYIPYHPDVTPGLEALHGGNGPHLYMIHAGDTGILEASDVYAVVARFLKPSQVCALVYDDSAFQCKSLSALTGVFNHRVLTQLRGSLTPALEAAQAQAAQDLMTPIPAQSQSHDRSFKGSDDTGLVLFDIAASTPLAGTLATAGGGVWLGGEIEATLLLARAMGAVEWAENEANALQNSDPEDRDVEDLQMRLFWDLETAEGSSYTMFREFVITAGFKCDRLRETVISSSLNKDFSKNMELALLPGAAVSVLLPQAQPQANEPAV